MARCWNISILILMLIFLSSCQWGASFIANRLDASLGTSGLPKLSVEVAQSTLDEGDAESVNIVLSSPFEKDVVINLSLTSDDTNTVRFNPIPTQVTIAAGQVSHSISLQVIDDSLTQNHQTWTFSVSTQEGGVEVENSSVQLYISDNDGGFSPSTVAGPAVPRILRELNPHPAAIKKISANGRTFYVGSDASHGAELWVSNGTPLGTFLVKDIEPGSSPSNINNFTVAGSIVYFTATTKDEGNELWQTDGTTNGTKIVSGHEVGPASSSPVILLAHQDKLYFTLTTTANGREIYATDGTASGAQLLQESTPGATGSPNITAIASGNFVYFQQSVGWNELIYKTDGTSLGTTVAVSKFDTGDDIIEPSTFLFEHNGIVYFENIFYGMSYVAYEAFATDGTEANTFLLSNLYGPGSSNTRPTGHILNDKVVLYYNRDDSSTQMGFYLTDGSKLGTVKVPQTVRTQSHTAMLGVINNRLIYRACIGLYNCEIYSSQGVANDAILLKDIFPGSTLGNANSSTPELAAKLNSKIIFTATNATEGKELWVTDGTPIGTVILKDIFPGPTGSFPTEFTVNGSLLYFTARSDSNGDELWVTDGTPGGTVLLKDLIPGTDGSGVKNLTMMDASNLFFTAFDSQQGFAAAFLMDVNTQVAKSFPHAMVETLNSQTVNIVEHNGLVYFDAMDSSGGNPLWVTNGSQASTNKVIDLYTGLPVSDIRSLMSFAGSLFFSATSVTSGLEIFSSDGTANGTSVLKEIGTGSTNGVNGFGGLVATTFGKLFFSGGGDPLVGSELYVSDGTGPQTNLVNDITPGATSGSAGRFTELPSANKILFNYYNTATFRDSLWITGGSQASTSQLIPNIYLVSGIYPIPTGAIVVYHGVNATDVRIVFIDAVAPHTVTQLATNNNTWGGSFYFMNTESNTLFYTSFNSGLGQHNLHKTDGTPGGTGLVKTINSIASSGNTSISLVGHGGGKTYFYYKNVLTPTINQLWVTDGTSGGTFAVDTAEALTTPTSIYGSGYYFNGFLYFPKFDSVNGSELWRTDGTTLGTQLFKNIAPGSVSSSISFLTTHNGRMFFVADDGTTGQELWASDGTVQETNLVLDVNPGAASSAPALAKSIGGKLYFLATKVLSGREVWVYED